MDKKYRFSPMSTENQITESLEYIVSCLNKMSQEYFGEIYPISVLKLFSHYDSEYDYLKTYVASIGTPAKFNSASSYYTKTNLTVGGNKIDYIGDRVVDPYRLHVGCGDWEIKDFDELKKSFADGKYVKELRTDMLEVWHPDLDVLGYVVPPLE